ncbi:MAG: hypothetical protein KGS72_06600 [Cyanobacteria bacterium REEB67]|nr:hypothetical protein [Cyanobacteria bacterium REEB67]
MNQVQDKTGEVSSEGNNRSRWLIVRFLLLWMGSLVVIALICLLVDINWTRPRLETALGQTLHRQIKLGQLRWHLGLNGLMVLTRSLKITELDGDPFIDARGSNIGLAFVPLLSGKLIIKHLQVDHPEIWAVKLKPGAWNFEDLLDAKTTVNFMQFDSGTVHIVDATKDALVKESLDLNEVNFKFNWPRKGQHLPVFASCTVAGKGGGDLEVEGLTTTRDKNLADTEYDLNCKVTRLPSATLAKAMAIIVDDLQVKKSFIKDEKIANLNGSLTLKSKLKGSLNKGFAADVQANLEDVVLAGPSIGQVKTKNLSGAGSINLNNQLIAWQNIVFKLGGMEVKSKGDLKNWQNKDTSYTIDLSARPTDLASLSNSLQFSGPQSKHAQAEEDKMLRIFKTLSMSGKAFFDVNLTGDREKAKMLTQLEAEGLPVSKLVEEIAPELAPLLVISGVGPSAIVRGHFNSSGGRRVSIEHGTISIPDSTIKLDGEVDLLRDSIDMKFDLQDFPLKKAWDNALRDEKTRKKITATLSDTNPRNIVINGFFKAQGNIVRNKKGTTATVVGQVHDGAISYSDNTLDTTNISGTVSYKNDIVSIDGFKGKIGKGGHFDLSGKVFNLFTRFPYCAIDFAGTGVNFAHLGSVMSIFGLSFPAITEGHLTGTVKSLAIKITGNHDHPNVYFNAAPDDVSYQPPGLTRSLKAVSGNIIYNNDKITLANVGIVSHGNRLTTNLSISNLGKKAKLSDIHVKSDGIELGDIDYYLSSSVMPASLRKSYRDLLNAYKIKNLHGKIYGDLVVVPKPNDDLADLEGVIGCYSVGATVSKLNLPLERIAGTFAASGNELLIQDLSGYIRSTQFEMNGWVKDYKSSNPRWKTDLRANIAPNEFLDLVPALTQTISNGKLKIYSAGPMALRSKVEGDNKRNEIVFSAHADADDHLRISTPVAVINQPRLQELNLDGSVTLDQTALTLHNTNLTLGDASLKAQGLWKWSEADQPVTVTVLSTKPVSAKLLLELVAPGIDTKSLKGSIDGFVSLTGPLRHPILTGKVSLDHITNPDFNLFDMTGTISTDDKKTTPTFVDTVKTDGENVTPPPTQNPTTAATIVPSVKLQTAKVEAPRLASVARVDLDRLNLRKLSLTDVGGWIQIEPGDEQPDETLPAPPKLSLLGMTAKTAGGLIKLDGVVDIAKRAAVINTYLTNIHTEEVVDRLWSAPGELSGTMDGEIHLSSSGESLKKILANLEGTGSIVVKDGVVARFGQLQTKITQANLLEQGIFGFNFNNLLQSMVPVRTGEFKEVRSKFSIYKGMLAIKELRYSGDDLRMWGAGQANLPADTMDLEIAGNIPRVTESMLGGKIGNISRRITIQKFLKSVTFGRLENLPALPLIGDIASDKPRTFSFKVDASASDSAQITHSIEKSFKWLPNKQAASAHPVPGIKGI